MKPPHRNGESGPIDPEQLAGALGAEYGAGAPVSQYSPRSPHPRRLPRASKEKIEYLRSNLRQGVVLEILDLFDAIVAKETYSLSLDLKEDDQQRLKRVSQQERRELKNIIFRLGF
jgi:hypothetical protein